MATIILQAAGAFLGSFFGPIGTAIGSAAGAMGGYMIDRALISGTQTIKGPRLEGARPYTAEEGAPLPRVYGAARIGGTMIWTTRFEETKRVKRQGAKGGPKVTEYRYFANVAFALCEGEIGGVRRVWADGEELDLIKVEMRVYRGTQDQPVDPLIAVKQGDGNAPAYRGTAYVVFERLALEPYGNRVPQLQFEVIRPLPGIEQDIRALALIPGSTEYGLATSRVNQERRRGEAAVLNRHVLHAASDIDASLDELAMLCPNLRHVALVVTWYGDDLRAGQCRIRPAVAAAPGGKYSKVWRVDGVTRETAMQVSSVDGKAAYGGTPSDESVVEAIAAIKARGWEVTLYPFIMMDVAEGNTLPDPYGGASQPVYPWRGRMTCHPAAGQAGSADKTAAARAQIDDFCAGVWGYRRFVNHYANLAAEAGGVDGFLIGSELRGLTAVRDEVGAFPFVEQLCTLAADVRGVLGLQSKITYGADWSEYFGHHPADGSGDVLFHLDQLWAHPAINAVGIDNYMPLADWRDGDAEGGNPDGFASAHDLAGLRSQIAGGEGFDWYYASSADRAARQRTPITDGVYGKAWTFRTKDLVSWWSNAHYNRIGGVEQAGATAWVPRSKPIWFTEIGCPALDKGPNQPNVFVDPKSVESALPYFSSGERDDLAQRQFLRAHFEHWNDGAANPVSPVYGGPMVDTARLYVWAWDARPYPAFPVRADVWSDGLNWHLGHWLNGRTGNAPVGALINTILEDHGLEPADVESVSGTVHGFLVTDPTTARASLEPLLELFGIDAVETAGGLTFRDGAAAGQGTMIGELAVEDREAIVAVTRLPDHDTPAQAILAFRDPLREHQAATARFTLPGAVNSRQETFNFPGMLEAGLAEGLVERRLTDLWFDRSRAAFAVPAGAPGIEPGKVVESPHFKGKLLIEEIEEGIVRRVKARPARPHRPLSWRPEMPAPEGRVVAAGQPLAHLIDLPMMPGAVNPQDQFRLAAWQRPWRAQSVYASPEDTGFEFRANVAGAANAGELVEPLPPGDEGRVMHSAELVVELFDGEAACVSRLQMLNGANAAAVLAANEVWEVLQFETAQEVSPGVWRLSGLLRGQLGTSDASHAGAEAGAPFVMLDDAVTPAGLKASEIGLALNWRIGPSGEVFSSETMTDVTAAGGIRALTPLSPVHLRCKRLANGDRLINWVRRSRIDADRWDEADVSLGEESERYQVEISSAGGAAMRSHLVSAPDWTYAADDFAADFAVPPDELTVRVRQLGTGGRAGLPCECTFAVN